MRYVIDNSVQVLADGRQVMGGSPLRIFTLTAGGLKMLERLRNGEDLPRNLLIDRLAAGGAIHPQPTDPGPFSLDDVTFVVPAYGPAVVVDLGVNMIVVDDASPGALPTAPTHARVIRRVINGGPGAARMTGLAEVSTPLVAFVDADVSVTPDWLDAVLAHFVDDRVALVAPRVLAIEGDDLLTRFENGRSPLDLGPEPARVRPRTRVSYVPTAAIVARVDAVRAVSGFDPTMRTGEDVDLVWRLVEAGHIVRYEPRSAVYHRSRPNVRAWVKQRQGYGQSAGPLARRHPGALAPLGVSGWSAAVWGLLGAGQPVAAGLVGGWTAVALTKKLPTLPRKTALDLVRYGHLRAGRQIASALTRAWWPLAVLAALVSKRARRVVLAAAIIPALQDWRRTRPGVDPVRYVGLRVLDDVSYGWGLWQGAWRSRTAEPLTPDFTSWPRPSRFERQRPTTEA